MVIQRSWKILSDAGSTSASSTEANRSPLGMHSSSDDSNCSNQTTHSMVTSVASPIANKMEPPKQTVTTAATAAAASASTPSSTESITKYVTTPQMAETMLQRIKQRLGCPVPGINSNNESAMRSLELLRISVQSAFDQEIDAVMKRYMQTYFKPAFKNIKENLGQLAVTEDDTLQKMSCALLENSKAQYNAFRIKPQPTYITTTTHAISADQQPLRLAAIKRPAVKPTNLNELNKKLCPIIQPLAPAQVQVQLQVQPQQQQQQQPQQQQPQQQQPQQQIVSSTPVKALLTNANIPQPHSTIVVQTQKSPVAVTPARRQIFWNTAQISTTTKFVLDVQANQAFGFGTDGKERLASKHPELIRYLPDSEDRDWLIAQNIISQQNRNSRFLFLIHDEVCRLQQAQETYRSKTNVDLSLMHTFTVPEFMIQKMKLFFVDLNIKSRGLITNSFSVGALQGNSHLRNALLQGIQQTANQQQTETTATTTAATTTTTVVMESNNTINVIDSSSGSGSGGGGGAVGGGGGAGVGTNVNTTNATNLSLTSKAKGSTLSSSHATLTALLTNTGGDKPTTVTLRK